MKIKELFDKAENGTLTYEQFEALAKEANVKFADIGEGNYISKHKHEEAIAAKAKEIELLNSTVASRDVDLKDLQAQLKEAGEGYIKVEELTSALTDLQGKYDEEVKSYKTKLQEQAYEFAVKEFAASKEFTSEAAKREFIRAMKDADLKMDKDGNIIGKEDFATSYAKDNADSFKAADPAPATPPAPQSVKPQPQFVNPTPGTVATKPLSLTEMMKAANENPELVIQ